MAESVNEVPFTELLPLGPDETEYRLVSTDGVSTFDTPEGTFLKVEPEAIRALTATAMRDIAHYSAPGPPPSSSSASSTTPRRRPTTSSSHSSCSRTPTIAAARVLPMCQDTGTAIVMGKKGQTSSPASTTRSARRGIYDTYATQPALLASWRRSTCSPRRTPAPTCRPRSSSTRHPARPTSSSSWPRAAGRPTRPSCSRRPRRSSIPRRCKLPGREDPTLGTVRLPALPPRPSSSAAPRPRFNSKTVKLASTHYLDTCRPRVASGPRLRDLEWEARSSQMTREIGIGAQFGGKYFCHDVRVIRLPAHGASCPSASASPARPIARPRQDHAEGVFLEQLETDPASTSPRSTHDHARPSRRDRSQPADGRDPRQLSQYPVKTRVALRAR